MPTYYISANRITEWYKTVHVPLFLMISNSPVMELKLCFVFAVVLFCLAVAHILAVDIEDDEQTRPSDYGFWGDYGNGGGYGGGYA